MMKAVTKEISGWDEHGNEMKSRSMRQQSWAQNSSITAKITAFISRARVKGWSDRNRTVLTVNYVC